jgi:hypothetical protein
MKRLNYIFYRDQDRYLFTTGRSPRKFEGVLFVMWEGATPDCLQEGVRTAKQLQDLTKVEPLDVPDAWWSAFVNADQNIPPRPTRNPIPTFAEDFQEQPRFNRDTTTPQKSQHYLYELLPVGLSITIAVWLAWLFGMLR